MKITNGNRKNIINIIIINITIIYYYLKKEIY